MLTRRRVAAAAVLLSTALAGAPAIVTSAQAAPDQEDRSAVSRAAARYGVGASTLQARLQQDPTLRLAPSGVAYFVEPTADAPAERSVPAQAFPLEQTFKLHSKPGSKRTIYLDFDGHNVSGTLWNGEAGNNLPSGVQPAMDLAGNGPTFTDQEKLQIQDIFQRVAEDYAPFDVDVTTESPAAAKIDRAGAKDQVFGTRVVITSNSTAFNVICGGQCGGVAFIGVFNHFTGKDGFPESHAQLQPAFVFPAGLSNDPKNIAEATSHEVGHTLGLDHDGCTPGGANCPAPGGYYKGHDMWAPIMGVGYDRPVSQWALSDYPGADLGGPTDSLQEDPDDVRTIKAFGAPARADEAGSSVAGAAAPPSGPAYITTRDDVDVLALGTCSGNVTVTANNAAVSPNLDIDLRLLDASGALVDQDDPPSAFSGRDLASGLDATVTGASLPSGRYYARVDGAGRGAATTSYTDYGSLGAYTLQVTGCDGVVPSSKPGKPRIGKAKAGKKGGKLTASVRWQPPSGTTTPAIDGYQVQAFRLNKRGKYVRVSTSGTLKPSTRGVTFTSKNKARLKFAVRAHSSAGWGPLSAKSNAVRPR